jgi:tetratricopeptide (TPR) repeat protein
VADAIQQAIPTPLVGAAAAQLPMLAGLAMLGHVVGMLAHVHGDLIGWGSVDLFVDPLFPHMVAEGRRKIASRPDVDPSGDAAASPAPDALVSPRERADAAKLTTALKAEEYGRALRLYEARPAWSAAAIEDRQLIMLAKAAARAGKLALAQGLLEAACARGGRSVGQAWLALAQLHADALGQTDRAREIYSKIIEQLPGSDVAKLAAAQIGHASQAVTA